MSAQNTGARAGDGNDKLAQRITNYLADGGLFNPERAKHDAVRDLLIECRNALAATPAATSSPADDSPYAYSLGWEEWYRKGLAAAPAPTLTLTGEMHSMGDMGADDMPQPETPRVVIGLADGRNLMVIGLTRDEVVALAPHFLERVTVQVGTAVQAPATADRSQA